MGKKVIITGASGMIGGLILQHCLNGNDVTTITTLVRRPSERNHPKLNEVVVDFDQPIAPELLVDHDLVFYCIGVYTGQVSRSEFKKLTVEIPLVFARSFQAVNPQGQFLLLSGQGADRSGQRKIMFAQDKGEVERELSAMNFSRFFTFRPGYIYPVERRKEPNVSYKLMRVLYPLIRLMGPKYSVTSTDLALAMYRVGMQGWSAEILENSDILAVANSDGRPG